jgi:RNA polymerase sigma-70 factor, ECF subfamily
VVHEYPYGLIFPRGAACSRDFFAARPALSAGTICRTVSDVVASSKLSLLDLSLRTTLSGGEEALHTEVLALFDEHAPGLHRYVCSFGLGTDGARDIVQEVFLSLHRHLSLDRPRTNLKGWLFRVAHNLALKQRRTVSRRMESALDDEFLDRLFDPAANPEERVASDQRRLRLRAVLRALPDRDQRCLYLRAEGLPYRDIGKALGISLGSVAKSLNRSLTRLMRADIG